MGRRRPLSKGPRLSNELKGKTLNEAIELGISITFQCETCDRLAFWPWPYMKREKKFDKWRNQYIHALADKLRCAACRSRDFYLRPFKPSDQKPRPGA